MKIFSIPRRMANAAVVFVRRRGLISDHARETGQSREKITTLEEQLKQATVINDDRTAEFAARLKLKV